MLAEDTADLYDEVVVISCWSAHGLYSLQTFPQDWDDNVSHSTVGRDFQIDRVWSEAPILQPWLEMLLKQRPKSCECTC